MLIVEIAVGVFLGGIGLWAFMSYLERKRQAQYVEAQIKLLFRAADERIAQRFQALSTGYLDVFRDRLTTIFDDPECSPVVAAQAEFNIFMKQTEQLKTNVAAEVQETLKEKFLLADKIGAREKLKQHIDRLIGSSIVRMSDEAMLLLSNKLLSLNNGSPPSGAQGHISGSNV